MGIECIDEDSTYYVKGKDLKAIVQLLDVIATPAFEYSSDPLKCAHFVIKGIQGQAKGVRDMLNETGWLGIV